MAVEEIARRMVGRKPILVQQKIVYVIGENQLFDLDALLAEACDEIHRLGEVDVAVVVPVNEQDRRLPGVHGGYPRRFIREFVFFSGGIFFVPIFGLAIVLSVLMHASGKDIGIAPPTPRPEINNLTS